MAIYRIFFALLALSAVLVELLNSLVKSFSVVSFFSFFTIEGNIFAAAVFLVAALWAPKRDKESHTLDVVRGAATLYMVTVGVVFGLFLSGVELPTSVPWTNTVLHHIMPVVVALDWLLDPPRQGIPVSRALIWLAFPVLWIVYTLARGSLVGWYPYPFLNPDSVGGYSGVALYSLGVGIGMAALTWLVVWSAQLRRTPVP